MNLTDYLITGAAILISFLIGICSYFIVKWMEGVDATTQKHSDVLTKLTIKVGSLESAQNLATENITKGVSAQLAAIKFPGSKFDETLQEVRVVKEIVQKKLLPLAEVQDALLGRVTVLEVKAEKQAAETNKFVSGLAKLAASRKTPEQK